MSDVAPQINSIRILIICEIRKRLERILEKRICKAKSVIDNSFDAIFRRRPQAIYLYRAWSNHPFNGWLQDVDKVNRLPDAEKPCKARKRERQMRAHT